MNAPGPLISTLAAACPHDAWWTQFSSRTSHPVIVTDATRRITWANAAFCALSGYPLADVLGCSPGALLQCEDTDPAVVQSLREQLDEGLAFQGVLLNRTRSGRRYWVDLEIQPFGPEGQAPQGFFAIALDLTSRNVEVHQLRATLDNTAAGFVVQDDQGRIVDCNPAAVDLLGLTQEQMMGRVTFDPRWQATDSEGRRLPKEDHPAMRTLRTGCATRHFTMGIGLPDGGRRWLLVDTNVLPRASGPNWVVSSFVDMTSQRELEQRLQEQSRRLTALFDLSPVGLALYDMDKQLPVDCNAAMCRINGFSRDEVLNGKAQHHVSEEHLTVRHTWLEAARTGVQFGPLDSSIIHRDGHRVDVVMSGAATDELGGSRMVWLLIHDVSERKSAERALLSAARQDRLTGLPNRAVLTLHLEALVERAQQEPDFGFAVMFLDFDRFKLVNDTLGHDAGDDLLRSIARRLRQALPTAAAEDALEPTGDARPGEHWLVTRFGGDEFVILAPGVCDEESASAFADYLMERLADNHLVKGMEIQSSASMGIALGSALTTDGVALLSDADTAMYEAKRLGRRTYAFFDEAMREKLTRTLRLEEALHHALPRGQMWLEYQPIVDLGTGEPVSVEALVRWHHPTLGPVSPAEFVPIAEENGMIVALGRWVLLEACAAWARWQVQAPEHAPGSISVNLSRVQMAEGPHLLAIVSQALREHQIPPGVLQLEVTEREVMHHPKAALELIQALRALGVRIAMDDFGTGSSSLACLREYPFDVVKIDKSFVTNLCGDVQVMAVAHATVSVIENLGKVSVAEGVETAAEVAALQAMGCRYGQGFLFSRPVAEGPLLAFFGQKRHGPVPDQAPETP